MVKEQTSINTGFTTPPLAPKVIGTLQENGIHTPFGLKAFGVERAFLLLKASGLTVTRSVLWQLWAQANQCLVNELTEQQKQQLWQNVQQHPPVEIFPDKATLEHFMQLALDEADKAYANSEVPIGAIVVADGQIIGTGYNQCVNHNQISAHAEMIAIRQASQYLNNYRLSQCDLYCTLEPCPMCSGAIIQSRIRRLIIGADEPKTGAAGSVVDLFALPTFNCHTSVLKGVLLEDCQNLLKQFFMQKRQ